MNICTAREVEGAGVRGGEGGGGIGLNTVVVGVLLLTIHDDCVASCIAGTLLLKFACYIYDIHANAFSLYT